MQPNVKSHKDIIRLCFVVCFCNSIVWFSRMNFVDDNIILLCQKGEHEGTIFCPLVLMMLVGRSM